MACSLFRGMAALSSATIIFNGILLRPAHRNFQPSACLHHAAQAATPQPDIFNDACNGALLNSSRRSMADGRNIEGLITAAFDTGSLWVPLGLDVLIFLNPFTAPPRFTFPSPGLCCAFLENLGQIVVWPSGRPILAIY